MHPTWSKLQPGLLRSLSAVSLHKVVQVAGLVVTVVLVPRLFGAEAYGRFAFALSLSYLGQVLGDFGTLDVMGRFVPGMAHTEASRLYMRHLAFKVGIGLGCGLITAGAALLLGPWMRPSWAGLIGLGVALHIITWIPFQFALGLNRVGAWMSEQAWRQWILLGLLLLLLPPWGLGGALLALVLMELIFLGLGLWLVGDYWQAAELRLEWSFLRPYVRFGVGFFLANLATVALYRSGPLLVESLTGQSTETGYFNLAIGLFLLAYVTMSQFAQSLIPPLSDFYQQDQLAQVNRWLARLVGYGWLVGWLGVVGVWAVTGWAVPLVFGADFAPAAPVLNWISLAMPLTALLWAGNVAATVSGRGRLKFVASLVGLGLFSLAALWLVPAWGAVGAAWALGLAVAANGLLLTGWLRSLFRPDWLRLAGVMAGGLACVAGLVWWQGGLL